VTDILLITGHRTNHPAVARLVRQLKISGFTVRIASTGDPAELGKDVVDGVEARRLRMSLSGRRNGAKVPRFSAQWARVVARNAVVRTWIRVATPPRRTWLLARYDPWLRRSARNADLIVAGDPTALPAARRAGQLNPRAEVMLADDPRLHARLELARAVTPLRQILRTGKVGVDASEVVEAWKRVEANPDDPALRYLVTEVLTLVQTLRRHNALDAAGYVVRSALGLDVPETTRDRLRLQQATLRIVSGEHPGDLAELVRAVMKHADDALRAGRVDDVVPLVMEVTDAVFHRELHADVLVSPLVSDPAGFLAPLRQSRTYQALGAPSGSMSGLLVASARGAPQQDQAAGAPSATASSSSATSVTSAPAVTSALAVTSERQPHRLLIVPGDYPHFTKGIISALARDDQVDLRVLYLREPGAPPRRHHRPLLIGDRLRDALGLGVPSLSEPDAELLDWAETIFVDWCDNAAQWVAIHAPAKARLVVRFHSLEAISPQPHMIDWSRVSDVIFVGDHVRRLVERAVPGLAQVDRIHIVPNEMRLRRFGLPKRPGAERTLAMVGWAQRVKDPIWALEVLSQLRAVDPRWRLMLIGHDFSHHQHLGALRYRDRFRARAREDDVRDGIVYVPYTNDLPEALRDAGFIISASRREGFPVGPTEGAASGAVPVIRDWPLYAAYDGARGIFPSDWVVGSVEEATKRILTYADAERRDRAGAEARDYVVQRYDWSVVEPRFREALLGSTASPRSAGERP
jgi:glycosyltransferase involved in cell wall biosynthesis